MADAAANLAPEADITTMVGPGGDPHTYQPTTHDIEAMKDADLVLWNGLHLEAQMVDQLKSLGDKQLAVGDQLDKQDLLPWPEQGKGGEQLYDPHIWNSPKLWSQAVESIGDKLGDIDSEHAADYSTAADNYESQIAAAQDKAKKELAAAKPRVLITGHDAFNYFGKTFDFDIHATDFVTTEATKSATEISELADTIADKRSPSSSRTIKPTHRPSPRYSKPWSPAAGRLPSRTRSSSPIPRTRRAHRYLPGAFEHNAHTVAKALS